ncbi:neutral zinc metallopeptidase [Planobispora takensis]|uniref:Metalloprotease n=1 Tax=Planobispora takensis TaxID=1367882 RepID=A0A8J3WWV5_9ACTN|nr:neutral zinc metallopeptidase [Planobispora takensis]GII04585.1 hypothetical protein Pta02_65930 [Planobispora takensis]
MRTPLSLLVACLLAVALCPGTAHASGYPVKDSPVLTDNALYETGRLKTTSCRPAAPKAGSASSAERYLRSVARCLDATWSAHLRKAGKPFTPPRIRFHSKPRDYCGRPWPKDMLSDYCLRDSTIVFLLNGSTTKVSKQYAFMAMAHEYAHHVQKLYGIQQAYAELPHRNTRERYEQTRRYDLQADCLSAAFARSVWKSLDLPKSAWKDFLLVSIQGGDGYWGTHEYGKGESIVQWLLTGYDEASPGDCNTWTAGPSWVA